jgi:hypothetical protein
VRDGENGLLVAENAGNARKSGTVGLAGLGPVLQRAVAWWESGNWTGAAEANARLIAEHATLRANVQQFLAVHRQVRQAA